MGMKKTIPIDGRDVTFQSSAAIPRLYRIKFKRDIYSDMESLSSNLKITKDGQITDLPPEVLETFENIAYIMAKHADGAGVPDSVEEWLDGFEGMFSIYNALPDIMGLWADNMETIVPVKKKGGKPPVK